MALSFHQFPYGSDNYGVLVNDDETGATACVDAGDASAALEALSKLGWTLSDIWITHHHGDHTAGLAEIKSRTGAKVTGPDLPHVDHVVKDGDVFSFSQTKLRVLQTPGHTLDMLNFYLEDDRTVFTGDTLFVLGCGRLFEGSAEQMHESLQKLAQLPSETVVYCSHEYTVANAAFALSVDPDNPDLIARANAIKRLRSTGEPTVPTTIGEELATNPFLRVDNLAIRQRLRLQDASDSAVFAELRSRKDRF